MNEKQYAITFFEPARPYIDKLGKDRLAYDNKAIQSYITWDQFVKVIKSNQHELVKHKTDAYMFNACQWKLISDPTVEVVDKRGTHFVRKCEANVLDVSMLIIDYDDGTKIEDILWQWVDYQHIGYTSFSHTPEHNKLRIILPLGEPIPAELLTPKAEWSILPALEQNFPNIDGTSFDRARAFFLPSCQLEQQPNARIWDNPGKLYDWKQLRITIRPPRPDYVYTPDNTVDLVELFRANNLHIRVAGGIKHEVICPWHTNHTNQDQSGTAIWEGEGFNCYHDSCRKKTRADVLKYFGITQQSQTTLDMEKDKLIELIDKLKASIK